MSGKAPASAHCALNHQTLHPQGAQLDQFYIGDDGALYVAWVIGTGQWQRPVRIGLPRAAIPGSPVAANLRRTVVYAPAYEYGQAGDANDTDGKDGYETVLREQLFPELDVFFVGIDGAIHIAWVMGTGQWQGPVRITDTNVAPPGACIKAVHQGTNGQLDVLWFGNDGALNVMWAGADKVGPDGWRGPVDVSPKRVNREGGNFVAVPQGDDQLDVLFIGTNGGLQVAWVSGLGAWHPPVTVSPADRAPPGGGVCAASQGPNQLSALFFDNAGQLNVSWVVGVGSWEGPVGLGPMDVAPRGANIACGHQGSPGQLDVFFIANNGQLHVSWVVGAGLWQGPVGLGPVGIVPEGSPVATFAQTEQQLTVFTTGADRFAYWVVGLGTWQGPVSLPDN